MRIYLIGIALLAFILPPTVAVETGMPGPRLGVTAVQEPTSPRAAERYDRASAAPLMRGEGYLDK